MSYKAKYAQYKTLCSSIDHGIDNLESLPITQLISLRRKINKCLKLRKDFAIEFFEGTLDIPHCLAISKLIVLKYRIDEVLDSYY